jgi:hypothetical protein
LDLLFDPLQDIAPLLPGPIGHVAAKAQPAAGLCNGHMSIQQLQQCAEQAQGKTGKPQKRMGQDGKRPAASVPFAMKPLNADPALTGKFIALVGAVFDDVVLVVAPMTGNGAGLIFLGNFIQIQYDVQQLVGHGYSPFLFVKIKCAPDQ